MSSGWIQCTERDWNIRCVSLFHLVSKGAPLSRSTGHVFQFVETKDDDGGGGKSKMAAGCNKRHSFFDDRANATLRPQASGDVPQITLVTLGPAGRVRFHQGKPHEQRNSVTVGNRNRCPSGGGRKQAVVTRSAGERSGAQTFASAAQQ